MMLLLVQTLAAQLCIAALLATDLMAAGGSWSKEPKLPWPDTCAAEQVTGTGADTGSQLLSGTLLSCSTVYLPATS
jgi:hypothetical protein